MTHELAIFLAVLAARILIPVGFYALVIFVIYKFVRFLIRRDNYRDNKGGGPHYREQPRLYAINNTREARARRKAAENVANRLRNNFRR